MHLLKTVIRQYWWCSSTRASHNRLKLRDKDLPSDMQMFAQLIVDEHILLQTGTWRRGSPTARRVLEWTILDMIFHLFKAALLVSSLKMLYISYNVYKSHWGSFGSILFFGGTPLFWVSSTIDTTVLFRPFVQVTGDRGSWSEQIWHLWRWLLGCEDLIFWAC
jgi:hypothetical protein